MHSTCLSMPLEAELNTATKCILKAIRKLFNVFNKIANYCKLKVSKNYSMLTHLYHF